MPHAFNSHRPHNIADIGCNRTGGSIGNCGAGCEGAEQQFDQAGRPILPRITVVREACENGPFNPVVS